MSLLRLEGVGRRHRRGGAWVLRGIDLRVPAGALVRIEGANGSGKSTLLRVLAGLDAPSEGRVVGRPRTAYVPERFPATMPLTAMDYLTHLGRVHGLSRAAAPRSATHWLERFGAAGHARTPMSELSKGTSQKVAVAQALLAEAELLVLDEAWTGLDAPARAELDRALHERTAAGTAVVFVDHAPRRLAGTTARRHHLRDGSLSEGHPDLDPGARSTVRIEAHPPTPAAAVPEPTDDAGPPAEPPLPEGPTLPAGIAPTAKATYDRSAHLVRLTVPADASDAALRALLTAAPSWHIRSVAPLREDPR